MKHHDDSEEWNALRKVICHLLCPPQPPKAVFVNVMLHLPPYIVSFQGNFMTTLPDDKTASGTIAYVDAKGFPAKVDGAPQWSSSDDTVFSVAQDASGLAATITPTGLGTAQVRITADADLGSGVQEIITIGDIEVVGGQAVAGNLTLTVSEGTGPT